MKRFFLLTALAFVLAACSQSPQPKYVFYLIGDGMGVNQVMATEQYNQATGKGPEQINFAHFPVRGFITTVSGNSLVTDSAAGGTALATGVKTYNGAIGVNLDTLDIASVADWAREAGFGVGVATSVGVNHATPASFYAHTFKRSNYETIAGQLIETPVDFAAGSTFLVEKKTGHNSAYFENLATEAGITVLKGVSALQDVAAVEGRVICLSDKEDSDLPYAIDREAGDVTLSHFVQAGIDYLEAHFAKKGFFFMIEGGKIDYAGHSDDAATCFQEVTDFAAAIDLVLAFRERHPNETLIVVTADHETGGLMLGAGSYEIHPDRLAAQEASAGVLTSLFKESFFPEGQPYKAPSWEQVKAFFTQQLGLWDTVEVSKNADAMLKDVYEQTFGKGGNKELGEANLYSVNAKMVSEAVKYLDRAAGYQWSHGSHSGSPVGLYVLGCGSDSFLSVKDNAQVAPTIATVAGYQRAGK